MTKSDEKNIKIIETIYSQVVSPYNQDDERVTDEIQDAELALLTWMTINASYRKHSVKFHAKNQFLTEDKTIDAPLQAQRNLAKAYIDAGIVQGQETANALAKSFKENVKTVLNEYFGVGRQ